jgi:pyoverdine/dityrosine biosynthesis protein Dit1/AcrR family transcriptional regulator
MTPVGPAALEQARARRSRLAILEAALASFGEVGWEAATYQVIAARAGVSPALACRYFPTKELFALAAYEMLASELEARVVELATAPLAERFAATMSAKIELLERHRAAFVALAGRALDPQAREAVLGPRAEMIRARVSAVFEVVLHGATDAPTGPASRVKLARTLYLGHLALVLVWTQDASSDRRAFRAMLALASDLLGAAAPALDFLLASPWAARLDEVVSGFVDVPAIRGEDERVATILRRVFRQRRALPGVADEPSEAALLLHAPLVRAQVRDQRPIELVLPAFPAKSPSAAKVLGKLPDAAEEIALATLERMVADLAVAHEPGASLVICSDGHVFADAVGVRDADVALYRKELERMVRATFGSRARIFGLEDVAPEPSPAKARAWLLAGYGESIASLRERAERAPTLRSQIDGVHRFLAEDLRGAEAGLSLSQAKKRTRDAAYEVVRRSEAWGRLLRSVFPSAVRLSIHPQPDVSEKIGVHLAPTEDAWLTPWHAVALFDGESYRLVHRVDAEALGAVVVEERGRPYAMSSEGTIA